MVESKSETNFPLVILIENGKLTPQGEKYYQKHQESPHIKVKDNTLPNPKSHPWLEPKIVSGGKEI